MAHVPIPVIEGQASASNADNKAITDDRAMTSARVANPNPSRTLRWATNFLYAVLLVIMALIPSTFQVAELSVPDWLAHALAYGFQAGLLFWAVVPSLGPRRGLAGAFLGATAFGVATEGLQLLQPARTVELKDLLANTVGAMVACGIIVFTGRFGWRSNG